MKEKKKLHSRSDQNNNEWLTGIKKRDSYLSFLPFMLPLFLHLTILCLSYITIKLSYQMNERKKKKKEGKKKNLLSSFYLFFL
jgi:hypothetical protein